MKKRNHDSSSREKYYFLTIDFFKQSIGVKIVFHKVEDARTGPSSLIGLGADTSGTFLTGLGKSGGNKREWEGFGRELK